MPSPDGRCPECGFDPHTVSPSDAAVAARSYPRRFRALLVRPDDDDPDIVRRRPSPDEPSAVDHAASAAAGMDQAAAAVQRVRVQDTPVVELVPVTAPPGRTTTLEAVLERLTAAAVALAAAAEAMHGEEWQRSGLGAGGERVDALDIARAGVHAGIHSLRGAERTLARVR